MILVDAGSLVALFNPKDHDHQRCRQVLKDLQEPLWTTTPVLTEAFHMLGPASIHAAKLRDFVAAGALEVWFMDNASLMRCFELMEQYADHPMDMADATLVAAAETLNTRQVFTIDRNDFESYRVRRGHRHYPMVIVS